MCCFSCTSRRGGGADDNKRALGVYETANKLFNEGKIKQSLRYIDSAYGNLRIRTTYAQYLGYSFKSLFYFHESDLDASLRYEDSALDMMKDAELRHSYPQEYVHALLEKGHILSAQHNYDKAHDYYVNAIEQARELVSSCSLNEYYYLVAMALYREKQFPEAAGYFKDAFIAAQTCSTVEWPYQRMQELLDNIALCYTQRARSDSAVYYYDSCVSFINKHEQNFGNKKSADEARSVAYENKAMTLVMSGKLDGAEDLLKQSIHINEQPGYDKQRAQSGRIKLAAFYSEQKNYAKAYSAIMYVSASLDTLPNIYVALEKEDLLWHYYKGTGQFEKALATYQAFVHHNDSVEAAGRQHGQTDILHDLREKEQQYKIQLLQKDNHFHRTMLMVAIAFGLMALVITILIFRNYRKTLKSERLLAARNEEILKQKTALQKSNLEKDRILSIVTHDLRNPIGATIALADMLDTDDKESRTELIAMMKEASENALALINELVTVKGDEHVEVKKERMDLVAFVKETLRLMDYKLKEKKQVLETDLLGEPLFIAFDKEKMRRVIGNIVGNAAKFTHEGGTIFVSVAADQGRAIISIKDNGIGIPEKLLPELFGMFTAAKRPGTSGEQSFGLGLSISRQITEAHGGKIWAESKENNGSTFYISLPVR